MEFTIAILSYVYKHVDLPFGEWWEYHGIMGLEMVEPWMDVEPWKTWWFDGITLW